MAGDLRELTKRERQLLSGLDFVERFFSNYDEVKDRKQLSVRLQVLEKVADEFYTVRAKIELLTDDVMKKSPVSKAKEKADGEATEQPCSDVDTEEENQRREDESYRVMQEFDERYCTLKAELLELQAQGVSSQVSSGNQNPQLVPMSKVKLPEIRLPSFSGKVRDWITFRDTFRSLIHVNPQLTDMDKFTYLRSSLSGEALHEVNSIELSAANYEVAWQALQTRYENRKLIVKAYLDALFAVDNLKRESYDGLSHLISQFEKNLQMLDKIGQDTAQWSTILAYMVCSKLDSTTLRHWETHHGSKEVPTFSNLMTFLRNHCSVLQSVATVRIPSGEQRNQRVSVSHTVVRSPGRCPFCGDTWHGAFQCARFQRMRVAERNEAVNRNKLCRNCLQPGHLARTCEKGVCHHCRQRHHSLLHTAFQQFRSSVPPPQFRAQTGNSQSRQPPARPHSTNQSEHTQTANTTSANSHSTTPATTNNASTSHTYIALPNTPTHNVILSTAIVTLKDRYGNSMLARALLDSCSQHCLMTASFSKKLRFCESSTYLSVQGIGSSRAVATRLVSAEVAARSSEISPFTEQMQFFVLPKLTLAMPTFNIDPSRWRLPPSAILADPWFCDPGPIDIIIGAEYFMDLLQDGRHKATRNGPTLQNTAFGWIISGRVPEYGAEFPVSAVHVCSTARIEEQLTKFWELETCRTKSTHSIEESTCEEFFAETTTREETGRFVVTLPKKEFVVRRLGESKNIAVKRFIGLERRFSTNPELKRMYSEFIHEYFALGHMKEVVEESDGIVYYLPHHAVLKPDSTTTKLRVVFDASCRTSSGVSLNDALMVGPVVQDDLLDVILRFRLHQYAVVADIAKMYRMVGVQPADQRLQRIVWRDSTDEPIRTFKLTTVTYGTASAPYLATKCLQRLSDEGEHTHPVASKVLKKDFYVDDMLAGVDEIHEGRRLVGEMVDLMESAGFSLRKWNSNSKEILLDVPEHLRDSRSILELESSDTTIKTLGLAWEPSSDSFRFNSPTWNASTVITKRTVLSDVARLFDPLGLVGPVIIQAKIFVQELWKQECGWDEPLSSELQEQWHEYRRNLGGIQGLTVPRWISIASNTIKVEYHGFCDASEKAYGACIYVRTVSETNTVAVNLLISKSRVAPLENLRKKKRKQSIPRLELSSALLLAHLYEKVSGSTQIEAKAFFYTDSMITKCWLSSTPSRWNDFVGNRSSEIQHITKDCSWNHVPGLENPADIISRGMTPAQLQYQSLWFHGPHWLMLDEANWPQTQQINEDEIDKTVLEEKGGTTAALQASAPSEHFSLRSSFTDLVRLTAYILRFRYNAQAAHKNCRRAGYLTTAELQEALRALVALAQAETLPQELADLNKSNEVRGSSAIIALHPQLIDGIICVGGRLQYATVSDSRKHPFILDHRHPFATTIVEYYHKKLFHAGQQLLVSAVREKFWPTNARDLARKVIHKCVPCFRVKPKIQEQLMADLPPERVTPCSPFQRVGVDYCGPFYIVYPQRRVHPIKCFVAVYVCLVTKVVHLELVADMTAQAFIASLRRFVSRRGKPELLMCDNGTNFVGAKRELDELYKLFSSQQFQEQVTRETANDNIEFRFIPARSPNFGGLWESAVKSFKTLFKRTIGTTVLVYDEMATVLCQIEAILNSRPLTPISNDPSDFEALTPGHFLVQRPLTAIPEPSLEQIPENRLGAWQKIQKFTQQIWKQWSKQYLSNLQNRTRWMRQRENMLVGMLVILKDENQPSLKWPLARITEVHPGPDGRVRVVTVLTKDGSFRRAISKICLLPIRDNIVSSDGEN